MKIFHGECWRTFLGEIAWRLLEIFHRDNFHEEYLEFKLSHLYT